MINKNGELVTLKDNQWLTRQRYAGTCVARILAESDLLIKNKTPNLSLNDLEQMSLKIMKDMGCDATFKGYRGFPSAICTSVNKHLVHGIVNDYILHDGDVISVDLGATFEGAIADAASTFVYGEPQSKEIVRMIDMCRSALQVGINAVKVGNRIGAIGNAIHKLVKNSGFGLITKYGGHGIDYYTPHSPPFVANRADKNDGVIIRPGLTIAIEPMLVLGQDTHTTLLDDKWTVLAQNISAHFEHSIFVHDDSVEIITEYNQA